MIDPRPRRRVLLIVAVAASITSACIGARGLESQHDSPLPEPPPYEVGVASATTIRVRSDTSNVAVTDAPGQTTIPPVLMGPGPLNLVGTVSGPSGPVAGAVVRVERFVDDNSASIDLLTDALGQYRLDSMLGGHIRVSAWRAPDLISAEPLEFFAELGGEWRADLGVQAVGGVSILSAIAPDPPAVGKEFVLAIRVAQRSVNPDGSTGVAAIPGVSAVLKLPAGITAVSSLATTTDATGVARWTLRCQSAGYNGADVTVSGLAATQFNGSVVSQGVVFSACGAVVTEPTTTTTTVAG